MVDEKDSRVDGSSLRISASKWIREALDASLDDDDEKVSLTAPLAVELLGKAVLWGTNPLLLLPTDTKPAALVDLARELDLASPKLRTVGLAEVLTRSAMLMSSFPLSEKQQNLVCDARNGVVHVGSVGAAREVIKHALRAIDAMLLPLNVERTDFYGDSLGVADTLLAHPN